MSVYDIELDEMTAGQLAVLEEVRGRLAAHCAFDFALAVTVTGVVDAYAVPVPR